MLQHGATLADRLASFFELSNNVPETKRRLFLIVQIAAIFLLIVETALAPLLSTSPFSLGLNALMILYLTALTWLLWRRRERQELILLGVFTGAAVYLLLLMLVDVTVSSNSGRTSLIGDTAPWFLWFVLLYMMCFLTFRAITALRLCTVASILFVIVLVTHILRHAPLNLDELNEFFLLILANALVLFVAYPLAHSQERDSETDFLTGLANRTRGYNILLSEIERAQRYAATFSVILLDLDHFKKINDNYGHPFGDAILCELAEFLAEHTRRTDLVCRWGGEEFLVVMTHTDLASARLKAEHLRQQIRNRAFHKSISLTASFGVTSFYPYDSTASILQRADDALYRAKRNGRNCIEVE